MAEYLIDNPPRRSQFRNRRGRPSGAIELHSAENLPDVNPPDTGAENVASFIRNRTDPGCYHSLVDSDSRVRLVPFHLATFGDGTGLNDSVIHISGAFKAHQWKDLPVAWKKGCIRNMALEAKDAMAWLKAVHGIVTPPRRITIAQARAGHGGFFTHGMSDPSRRRDPDNTTTGDKFPWDEFFAHLTHPSHPTPGDDVEPNVLVPIMYYTILGRVPSLDEIAHGVERMKQIGQGAYWNALMSSKEGQSEKARRHRGEIK